MCSLLMQRSLRVGTEEGYTGVDPSPMSQRVHPFRTVATIPERMGWNLLESEKALSSKSRETAFSPLHKISTLLLGGMYA